MPDSGVPELARSLGIPDGRAEAPALPVAIPPRPGILVVDDQALMRDVLEIGLRQQGFDVWLAAGGREALEVYGQERRAIRLVLLDVYMPGMGGPETLAGLRGLDPGVRACFMTGNPDGLGVEDLLRSGALRVFVKPFPLEELVEALHQLLGSVGGPPVRARGLPAHGQA